MTQKSILIYATISNGSKSRRVAVVAPGFQALLEHPEKYIEPLIDGDQVLIDLDSVSTIKGKC